MAAELRGLRGGGGRDRHVSLTEAVRRELNRQSGLGVPILIKWLGDVCATASLESLGCFQVFQSKIEKQCNFTII